MVGVKFPSLAGRALFSDGVLGALLPSRQVFGLIAAAGILGVAILGGGGPISAAGGDDVASYRIGPQDKLKISVVEWRASRNELFEWKPLTGMFTVGAAGRVSLPLLGEVDAADLTTAQLSTIISRSLKARVGMVEAPNASVEVVSFRPFYIVGTIEKPGEYEYRPGLTVLKAFTLAGGLLRPSSPAELRNAINARGNLEGLLRQETGLLARGARLEAELDGVDKVSFSSNLAEHTTGAADAVILQQEQAIFQTRRSVLKTRNNALEQLRSVFEGEVKSLAQQIKHKAVQVRLTRKEAGNVVKLAKRGLVTARRRYNIERATARIEAELLQVKTQLLRARQELKRVDIKIIEIENVRQETVSAELRATHSDLDALSVRIRSARAVVRVAGGLELVTMHSAAGGESGNEKPQPATYTIIRQTGSGVVELVGSETMAVMPGDTIKVNLPNPAIEALTGNQGPAVGPSAGLMGPSGLNR